MLVSFFCEIICNEQGTPIRDFEPAAIEEMKKYKWTGNIRELRNIVERLIILCSGTITADDVKMYATPSFL
jgi:DNA-binding NtrC family response regulator